MGKGLSWFRVYASVKGALDIVSDEAAGKALKATLSYFETGEEPTDLSIEAKIIFGILKQGADDSLSEFQARVNDGKRGAEIKKEKAAEKEKRAIAEAMEKYLTDDDGEPLPFN